MKTLLTHTKFLLLFALFIANQLISQNQPFLSSPENLNLPKDNLGVMPEWILEVNDVIDQVTVHKLYVYGMQGILIYDLDNPNWAFPDTIEFSEEPFGYYDRSLLGDLVKYPTRQPMIYVPESKGYGQLFVVSPDLHFICINPANDEVVHNLTSSHLLGFSLIASKLVFDSNNSRIMWLVDAISENQDDYISELLPVSLISYSIGSPLNQQGEISDFAINEDPSKNFMYVGLKADPSNRYWVVLERDDFSFIEQYKIEFDPGLIEYVRTQNIHQVYCLPNCKNTQQAAIYIFNGDSPSHSKLTINSPVPGFMCSAFNDVRNDLFLGTYTDDQEPVFNDIYIYHCQNNLEPTPLCTLNTNGFPGEKQNLPFTIEPVNGDVNLIMKRHEIVKLNYTQGTQCHYSWQTLLKAYGNFFGNADPTTDSRVFIASMCGGGFLEYQVTDNQLTLARNYQTGQAVHSCFTNTNSGKNYYFSKNHTANSHIFIDEDFTLGSFSDFSYSNPIGDCIYNPFQNHILVCDYIGTTNALLNAYSEVQGGLSLVSTITIGGTHNGEMFITNDGRLLYFSGGNNVNPKINIRSALNYNLAPVYIDLSQLVEFSTSDQLEVKFAGNPYQNYFVVSDISDPEGGEPLQPTSQISYFYVLNPANLSGSPSIEIQQDFPKFFEVTYSTDPVRGKLYAYVADGKTTISEIEIENQPIGMTFHDIGLLNQLAAMKIVRYSDENGPKDELYFVTWLGGSSCELYKYNPGSQNPPIEISDLNALITSMSFDSQTGLLYCYGTDNMTSVVYQFDVMNQFGNEYEYLNINSMVMDNQVWGTSVKVNDMLFDNENHLLNIPNGEKSSISRLGFAFDRRHIKSPDWNWLSFPRLERDGDNQVDAQPVLEQIRPFPDYLELHMINIPIQEDEPSESYINYVNQEWSGDLTKIQSTFGYKLTTDIHDVSYVPMLGSILDPSTEITIYKGHENWVGYFPTWPQDPFDALAGILDKLTLIKHHDWACVKDQCRATGPGGPPNYCWVCSITTPVKYADMLVLECSENVTFQWGTEFSAQMRELPEPEYFMYSEKDDYTPVFIELDSNDLPLEIGAFVADSCIGATVIEPGDSAIMLRAYMPDDTSGLVTFEKYYGPEKAMPAIISEYCVTNNATGIREKRAIYSGEKSKYYRISFKSDNTTSISLNPLNVSFNPNPSKGDGQIDYFLPAESDVVFEVYDIYGRKSNSLMIENEQAGNYSISWKNLGSAKYTPGIYFIRISACGNISTLKVIITE